MRGIGLFYSGHVKRNERLKLQDLHPIADYGRRSLETGDAGKDGYTILSRAEPDRQGAAPPIPGGTSPLYWGPAADWEQ